MKKEKYSYWISTSGKRRIFYTLYENQKPDSTLTIMYSIVRTTWLKYKIFRFLKINFEAKDKFAWLRN